MTFSILVWNILYTNQTGDLNKLHRLKEELGRLIDRYQPDAVVLSEVVQSNSDTDPAIVEFLQELGYKYNHYAQMANKGDYWMSGVALCSKLKLENMQRHTISKNGSAAKWGYPEFDKENISATIRLPRGRKANIILAHTTATVDSLKEHVVGKRNLEQLIRLESSFAQNTILAGDMNEWRFMPRSFRSRVKDIMHSKTGTFINPTWRHEGHRFTPLRFNLDYIYWSKQSDFRLEDFKILQSSASDHRPLFASFEFPRTTFMK